MRICTDEHVARNGKEISMKPGDLIDLRHNGYNGYYKGHNRRTHQVGLFPAYKVKLYIETFNLEKTKH